MHQYPLFSPNIRITIGLMLAALMLAFMFVDSLSRPTNIAWLLLGLSLASEAAGQRFATRRPSIAKQLTNISFYLMIVSLIYTIVLLFR